MGDTRMSARVKSSISRVLRMHRVLVAVVIVLTAVTASNVAAVSTTTTVSGKADPWFAGKVIPPINAGELPVAVDLSLFSGAQELNFSATGETRRDPVQTPLRDADGERPGDFCCGTVVQQLTGPTTSPVNLSGIISPFVSLVGVFIDSANISAAPPTLDFELASSRSFTQLSPSLQQLFFIGDGLTGTGTGSVQSFVIPANADTLYLGVLDGLQVGFEVNSSNGDNSGELQVTISAPPPVTLTQISLTGDALLLGPRGLDTDGTDLFIVLVQRVVGSNRITDILKMPISGGATSVLYTTGPFGSSTVVSIATTGPEIFWADLQSGPVTDTEMFRAPKDGSGPITRIYRGIDVGQPIVDGSGVTTDGTKLYTADQFQGRIHSLNKDGTGITQLAARYGAGFSLAHKNRIVESGGILYISDAGRTSVPLPPRVDAIATTGGPVSTVFVGPPLVTPAGIAVGNGTVFIADPGASNTIWSIPTTGGPPIPLISGPPFVKIEGLVFFNNALYVTDNGADKVYRIDFGPAPNQPPVCDAVTVDSNPTNKNDQPVSVTVDYTDPDSGDTITVDVAMDDSNSESVSEANDGQATVTHTYADPGVYEISATVDDGSGPVSCPAANSLIVIYDPAGGFVTGGGWINSPAGAYPADPTMTGKANFGFVSKYKKGASVPTGQTQFQFKAGNLNFHSTSYDWLVIAGAKAMYKGDGTVNGASGYTFQLNAIDGQINGGGGMDKFRIKIQQTSGGVIYDNQQGAGDNNDPTTALGGGSIKIHKGE